MIYLIGGVSKSGKTYISRKVMEELNIPFFSTDFLLWSLGGENGIFSYYDSTEIVSPILEEYILKIISFLNENNQDYVIEGTHITSSLYNKVKTLYSDNVKVIFLGYTNTTSKSKYDEIIKYEDENSNKWYKHISIKEFISFLDKQIEESKQLKTTLDSNLYYDVNNIEEEYKTIINKLIGM